MNIFYTPVLVLHVVVAVLGLGSTASIAIVAASARRLRRDPAELLPWLGPLLRGSAFSLATMLGTGILLDLSAKGAFRGSWWFRGSALLLIGAGALHGQARRTLRSWAANKADSDTLLRRVERLAYAMCAVIAGITVLMEVKPF
ncbi:MAG TPA: hypothetical protein VNH18_04030 [Bryobacteraceae bacterium]|nr:hypothetical protein [Bryobacteraceae bacterium]